jgi:hypothetical protein
MTAGVAQATVNEALVRMRDADVNVTGHPVVAVE